MWDNKKKNDVTSAGDICFCFQLTKMVIMTMIILWTATKKIVWKISSRQQTLGVCVCDKYVNNDGE